MGEIRGGKQKNLKTGRLAEEEIEQRTEKKKKKNS